jgi:predicted amidophosphoribosyltransferase
MSKVSMANRHIDNTDYCVCCGNEIPEGRQVCVICGYKVNKKKTNITKCKYCGAQTPNATRICKNCYDKLPIVKKLVSLFRIIKKECGE